MKQMIFQIMFFLCKLFPRGTKIKGTFFQEQFLFPCIPRGTFLQKKDLLCCISICFTWNFRLKQDAYALKCSMWNHLVESEDCDKNNFYPFLHVRLSRNASREEEISVLVPRGTNHESKTSTGTETIPIVPHETTLRNTRILAEFSPIFHVEQKAFKEF